jgi:hypothetical protein
VIGVLQVGMLLHIACDKEARPATLRQMHRHIFSMR